MSNEPCNIYSYVLLISFLICFLLIVLLIIFVHIYYTAGLLMNA